MFDLHLKRIGMLLFLMKFDGMWCCLYISVQFSSVTQSCPTLYDPMNRSTPGLPVHHQLPEFTQTHVHRFGDVIQPSHPLSSPSPPSPNPSQHQSLFQWVNSLHKGPKYWSFSFSISPSNEHPGLISFRMDWLDLLAEPNLGLHKLRTGANSSLLTFPGLQQDIYRIESRYLETFAVIGGIFLAFYKSIF